MELNISLIIPVYNRPSEIDELLDSLTKQTFKNPFEVIIVEDGSNQNCEQIVNRYKAALDLKYYLKHNTGAGLSRNFGMERAKGNYFIVLDSDIILPPDYLDIVHKSLIKNYSDAFGGPDSAHQSFSPVQKAINYAMTSFLTTGGLRGGKTSKKDFQARSFNMGLSKIAFEKTGGFTKRRIGEDIELSYKLKEMGFTSQLIPEGFVYHKRRSTFKQFLRQTYNFGSERPILTKQFPQTIKLTYWFPSLLIIGLLISILMLVFNCYLPLLLIFIYLTAIFTHAALQNKSLQIGILSVWATLIQFAGYGIGFLNTKLFK